ncbi:DUF167 domain-containing protein [Pseudodesulfovibrio alkaliphilus]|uniref:DUF167 domain-containing protein n=1 Tax=Pseudodesulfovibrio alkaliphilus TaxID=2661613 RepID=UPI003462985D
MAVWVQPGASRSEVVGVYQQCVRIRLCAPAVDNKANKALVAFVADALKVKKGQVSIESGRSARRKTLALDAAAAPDWIGLSPAGCPR